MNEAKRALDNLKRKAQYDSRARNSYQRVKNFLEAHERKDGEGNSIGGTGATEFRLIQFGQSPVARLLNSGNIGNEEMQAVEDITSAFHSIAGALLIKPQSMEKHDKSHSEHDPSRLVAAQKRYQAWANYWSARAKRGDKLLQIVVAAVIDEQAFHFIDQDLGMRNGKAKKALICGLRDYAARAGWADSNISPKWIESAESVFVLRGEQP